MSATLAEFFAHAVAMEDEAADRYLELADMMEAHRNDAVATVFRDMNHFSLLHRDEIRDRAGAIDLPRLKSWQYRWRTPPEVGGDEAFDYLMEPYHALKYARMNELRAMEYYRSVAKEADDLDLQRLANDFADEEGGHVEALDKWLAQTPRPAAPWRDDPDPLPPAV